MSRTGAILVLCLAASLVGIGSVWASTAISQASLTNARDPNLLILANQSQSQAQWIINATFNGSASSFQANFSQDSINYTDSAGRLMQAAYPLEITGNASQKNSAYYLIDTKTMVPIQVLNSYVTLGSVFQGYAGNQNATAAPQCAPSGLYAEWDFYVHVQPSQQSVARNVVVGRVCIYNKTIGWADALQEYPTAMPSANITVIANGATERLTIPDNNSQASSADGLVRAKWIGLPGIGIGQAAMPNGFDYFAVNGLLAYNWTLQDQAVYSRWYVQFYKFTQNKIPDLNEQFSPSSVGILSSSCNVVSLTNLTNASVYNAVNCMNSTASLYYSLANQQAQQLAASPVQSMGGYNYSPSMVGMAPAISLDMPAAFTPSPSIGFTISGQFLGYSLPLAAPRLLIATASPVTLEGHGTLNLLVQNYGRSQGLFTVSINGCPGIEAQPGSSYMIGPQQVVNVTAAFTAPNQNLTLDTQCAVQVKGQGGGGNLVMADFVSETPNAYLHGQIAGIEATFCNSDGIFTQMLCSYLGIGAD